MPAHPTWTSALQSHSPSLLHMTAFLEQGSPAGAQTSSRASPGISLEMQTRTPLPRPTESEPVRGRLCFKKPSGDDSDAAGVRTPLPIATGQKVFTRWARLCAHSQQLVQWSAQNIHWAPKRGSPYFLLIGESNPWCVASEGLPTLRLNPLSFLMGFVFHIRKSAPLKSSPGFFFYTPFSSGSPEPDAVFQPGSVSCRGRGVSAGCFSSPLPASSSFSEQ